MEKIKKIILALAFLFFLPVLSLYAEESDSDSDSDSPYSDYTWSETEYSDEEGWDGTENTTNSPADDEIDGMDFSESSNPDGLGSDECGYVVVSDSEGNLTTLSYDDVYDENGSLRENDRDTEVNARIEEYFADERAARTGAEAENLASRYSEAAKVLEEAVKNGNQEKIDEAKAALEDAKNALDAFCSKHSYSWEANGKNVSVSDKNHKTVAFVGDPVIISSGQFVINDSDIQLKNGAYVFTRHYVSASDSDADGISGKSSGSKKRIHGALGKNWKCSLDTRIVKCKGPDNSELLAELYDYRKILNDAESEITAYTEEDKSCEEILEKLHEEQSANEENIAFFEDFKEKRSLAESMNEYVEYGKAAEFADSAETGISIYVGDDDSLIPFYESETGETGGPLSDYWKNKFRIEKSGKETSILFLKSGEKRVFSEYGLPLRIERKGLASVFFEYDENNFLKRIRSGNSSLYFSWKNSLLSSVSDGQKVIEYFYDENAILTAVSDEENDLRRFEYDSSGNLKKQIKADGTFISFEYGNENGKIVVKSTVNENGDRESFAYDFDERKTVYTDYDGRKSVYWYDDYGRTVKSELPDGKNEVWQYDSRGLLSRYETDSIESVFCHDGNGNISEKQESGITETYSYSDSLLVSHKNKYGTAESYVRDENGRIIQVWLNNERLYSFSWSDGLLSEAEDCRGNILQYKYDSAGNLIKAFLYDSKSDEKSGSAVQTETWKYNENGKVSEHLCSDGVLEKYAYGDHSVFIKLSSGIEKSFSWNSRKLIESAVISDLITKEKRKERYEYDNTGKLLRRFISGTDTCGNEYPETLLEEFQYNAGGNTVSASKFNLNADDFLNISYGYSKNGNLTSIMKKAVESSYSSGTGTTNKERFTSIQSGKKLAETVITEISGGKKLEYTFDSDDRVLEVKNNGKQTEKNEYKASGLIHSEKTEPFGEMEFKYNSDGFLDFCNAVWFPDGKLKSAGTSENDLIKFEYDASGNLKKVISPSGIKEYRFSSEGILTGKIIKDLSGNIIYEENWEKSADSRLVFHKKGGKVVEKWLINAFGNVIKRCDSVENAWNFYYDILGRKIKDTDCYGNQTFYFYDSCGNLIEKRNPDGIVEKYSYNADGKLTELKDSAGIKIQKEYDDYGRTVSAEERPSKVRKNYEYDESGRIRKILKNKQTVRENIYEDFQKKTEIKDAKGKASTYVFDENGRLKSVRNRNGSESAYFWNDDGKISSYSDFNGMKSEFSYDSSRLKNFVNYSDGENFSIEYDENMNLISAVRNYPDKSAEQVSFSYDTAGKLTEQKNGKTDGTLSFEYDECGNLSKIKGKNRMISFSYGKKGETLRISDRFVENGKTAESEISFKYDINGKETERKWKTGECMKFYYDEAGREVLRTGFSSDSEMIFISGCIYDEKGRKKLTVDSDFNYRRYEYDERGRVVSIVQPFNENLEQKIKEFVSASGIYSLESSEKQSYDSLSAEEINKLKKLFELAGLQSFRLSGLKSVIKESFVYDANSNIIKRITPFGTVSFEYDDCDRLVSWGNGCKAAYDNNGNMIFYSDSFRKVEIQYDAWNRMCHVSSFDFKNNESEELDFYYDGLGRRVKTVSSVTGVSETTYIGKSLIEYSTTMEPESYFRTESVSRAGGISDEGEHSGFRYKAESSYDNESEKSADGWKNENQQSISDDEIESFVKSETFPLFSADGKLLCSFSLLQSDEKNQSAFMTESDGTVKVSCCENNQTDFFDYDFFGTPLLTENDFGFCGKKFLKILNSCDFGYRDYLCSFGRFTTEDPVYDGDNWYSLCAGDTVNFHDFDGLVIAQLEEQYMQSMGEALLGNSKSNWDYDNDTGESVDKNEYASKEGCLVTALAETLSALCGVSVSPSYLNEVASNFLENSGNLNWNGVCENYGLSHTSRADAESIKQGALEDLYGSRTTLAAVQSGILSQNNSSRTDTFAYALAVQNTLGNIMENSKNTAVLLGVSYDSKNPGSVHFVGAAGNVFVKDGVAYVPVVPTSENDKNVSKGSMREKSGWQIINGKVCVPVSKVQRIDTLEKNR